MLSASRRSKTGDRQTALVAAAHEHLHPPVEQRINRFLQLRHGALIATLHAGDFSRQRLVPHFPVQPRGQLRAMAEPPAPYSRSIVTMRNIRLYAFCAVQRPWPYSPSLTTPSIRPPETSPENS